MQVTPPCRTPPHHRADRRSLRAGRIRQTPAADTVCWSAATRQVWILYRAAVQAGGGSEGDVPGLGSGERRGVCRPLIDISTAGGGSGMVPSSRSAARGNTGRDSSRTRLNRGEQHHHSRSRTRTNPKLLIEALRASVSVQMRWAGNLSSREWKPCGMDQKPAREGVGGGGWARLTRLRNRST